MVVIRAVHSTETNHQGSVVAACWRACAGGSVRWLAVCEARTQRLKCPTKQSNVRQSRMNCITKVMLQTSQPGTSRISNESQKILCLAGVETLVADEYLRCNAKQH